MTIQTHIAQLKTFNSVAGKLVRWKYLCRQYRNPHHRVPWRRRSHWWPPEVLHKRRCEFGI
ncbi:LEAF RUST 10 DISEASE-RESISTANCE LOCUS RECEPTOR-LIKE PROTEIN KINASE-like 1.2 isoform X1 [Iris pallida]|uniref:LEAF RUST 10 DISEASE-RESISTANCE LOCUS RECEPTOR-LIKE PROTEIN KINASE-like 1.2 isoform X1 n=1 Tax=Iris pallida TaxID=29817 RepID=A0AAX6DJV7_IRIPA|nr:LEAF RUST 10 DISEASE-RESISTANCE LOCUS RECEPTOR-LIKE PROTEIN KINASE-like 1.2 isoform X1 [Iris pallida]KAJ6833862.1 LEAF RUST 10 DISEASE-RESISTANCE LOCUS RECEPTOR-LIKE PROTEIN KINASE-like 1.2 isoform X1 [Iris pallida]